MKLTKRAIEKIQPGGRDAFLWDDTPGFGVRVLPSGKRSFVLQYRNREGRSRRVTLGRFGVLTVAQARERARRLLVKVADGEDPAEERRQEASSPVFSELAARYLRDHATAKKKPGSVAEDRRLLTKHVLPALANRKVSQITTGDVDRLHSSMSGTPYEANRTLAVLSMAFACAERWGWRPRGSNPARGIEKYQERPRERFLTADELVRLGDTLRRLEQEGAVSATAAAAVRLLVLTGCRKQEICRLQWEDVDFERHELHLRDSKTGPKSVAVGAAAIQVLAGIERGEPSDWVFPARRRNGPLTLDRAWNRIRADAKLTGFRLHDLRHCYVSTATGAGLTLWQVGAVLGHKRAATTARYAHADRGQLHATAESVSARIATALNGDPPAEVVALEPR
jgi:integrase